MGDWDGPLIPDVEGLTIFHGGSGGAGYLIASSQGSNDFAIFERGGSNALIGKFRIGGDRAARIDRATDTDGIDVTGVPLGSSFPFGLFVAQDVANGRQNQNFKLVPWQRIARAGGRNLIVQTPGTASGNLKTPNWFATMTVLQRDLFGEESDEGEPQGDELIA